MNEQKSPQIGNNNNSDDFLSTLAFELGQDTRLLPATSQQEKKHVILDILRIQFVDLNKKLDNLTFASGQSH